MTQRPSHTDAITYAKGKYADEVVRAYDFDQDDIQCVAVVFADGSAMGVWLEGGKLYGEW